ncbi:MAG: 50S ribosomal protein L17 [Clostridiales bacterium]|jgi:large subunit ribosomal protein L17|nr:50S ribosomal protein L17 [Clostridiales bacterium]
MPANRLLNRPNAQRMAMLKGLVTAFLRDGQIKTTETRAKEVRSIVERLIATAVRETDHFSSKQVKVTSKKVDSKGKAVTVRKESKNKRVYFVVDRQEGTVMKTVDSPERLHARRQILPWVYRAKDADGKPLNLVNKLFDEIAPRYKSVQGGYTRIYKLGARQGDAAEMALLQLVQK